MDVDPDNSLFNSDVIIVPQDDDGIIELETNAVMIPALGIELHQGTFYQKYEDNNFYQDWSLTSINKIEDNPSNIIYYEQGDFYSTLNNFLTITRRYGINLDNLKVIVKINSEPEIHVPPKKIKEHY